MSSDSASLQQGLRCSISVMLPDEILPLDHGIAGARTWFCGVPPASELTGRSCCNWHALWRGEGCAEGV